MQVGIHASIYDVHLSEFARAIDPLLTNLGNRLSGEYGGPMEHLWISLELVERPGTSDGTPRHPFRLQKRVSGRSRFGLPPVPDKFNVGHFSVRPDFALISSRPKQQAISYALTLIYEATSVLLDKKRLDGFDARCFRAKFHDECRSLGYMSQLTD